MKKWLLSGLLLTVLAYSAWRISPGFFDEYPGVVSSPVKAEMFGDPDTASLVLVGIQPQLQEMDYASEAFLIAALRPYFEAAKRKGWFDAPALVLLPEYLGTWLVVEGERKAVFTQESINAAMAIMIADQPMAFVRHYLSSASSDPLKEVIFKMKAERMAEKYQKVLSDLASSYGVYIAGGSIVLPGAYLEDDTLRVDPQKPLENVSMYFGPDGRILPYIIRKTHPIEAEKTFSKSGLVSDLPVLEIEGQGIFMAICADSWYPEVYERAKQLSADAMIVPSYSAPAALWDQAWLGYNGASAPLDVDPAHVGLLTEREAWMTYALGGRASQFGLPYGLNVFLKGTLWDMDAGGDAIAVRKGSAYLFEDEGTGLILGVAMD